MSRIIIDGADVDFACEEGENILRAGLRAGIGLPYDCSIGTCGECKIQVVSGTLRATDHPGSALTERDVARGRALACQAIPDGDCTIRVRAEDRYIALHPPEFRDVRLLEVEAIAPQMRRCVFGGDAAATFRPGQYARLNVPGTSQWRAFSMSNLPNADGNWEFMIRLVEGGQASEYLFGGNRVGERFTVDAPYGNAYHRVGTRRIVCIAGGAGLAPMVSVARAAAADPACDAITMYYGGRSPDDLCAAPYLDPVARPGLGVALHEIVSGDFPDWSGARGFVHEHIARALQPADADADFYVAGPPAMVEAVLTSLDTEIGVPRDRVFYDRFFC